jgi:hypothetical protein
MSRRDIAFSFLPQIFLLTFANAILAAPPVPIAVGQTCDAQADGFLNARLGLWQQRLNLADWKISLVMSHASDLKPKTLGNIHWDSTRMAAVIRVLDASDYRVACRDALADMEVTLVHELVHLELSSLPRSQASRHEEELAVNRIAEAFLRLDRQTAAPRTEADQRAAIGATPDATRSRADTPGANTVSR